MISIGLLVLFSVAGLVFLYSAMEKSSAKSRADSIFSDWLKNTEVDERLRRRTIALLNNNMQTVERLLAQARQNHPDRSEQWYWEKILHDIERDRGS
jgi:lipoate synthase